MIGRKNFYGSGAEWAAHLAADVWTVTATAARHGTARHRASQPADRLSAGMRPQWWNCPGRSRSESLPAPDTPRTRPPSSRQRSRSRPVTPAIPQPGKASPCLSATCRPQGTTRCGSRSCRWMTQATAQLGEIIDLIRVPCRTSSAYCRARTPNWSMASAVRCMRCSLTGPTGKSGSDMTAVTSRGS